jgi:hypothetical protein
LYLLKSASFVKTYEAYYKKWEIEYKKRPLLHASPAAKWRITPAVSYSAQIRIEPVYRSFWDRVYNWIFRHSTLTVKYVYSLGNMRTTHRLTFPNSGYKIVRNAMTTSGSNTGYPYLSSYEEQSFIENVLGKNEGAMRGVWVPIWFIQGESSAIKDGRPNMIFRAYCRVLNDTYLAGYWEAIVHRSWCSS